MTIYLYCLLLFFATLFLIILFHITMDIFVGVGLFEFLYLVYTKQLIHYVLKKSLVPGDLVFLKYRGIYRKAFIKDVQYGKTHVQLTFSDKSLQSDANKNCWYPMSRIVLPQYLGKAAKILYSESENK